MTTTSRKRKNLVLVHPVGMALGHSTYRRRVHLSRAHSDLLEGFALRGPVSHLPCRLATGGPLVAEPLSGGLRRPPSSAAAGITKVRRWGHRGPTARANGKVRERPRHDHHWRPRRAPCDGGRRRGSWAVGKNPGRTVPPRWRHRRMLSKHDDACAPFRSQRRAENVRSRHFQGHSRPEHPTRTALPSDESPHATRYDPCLTMRNCYCPVALRTTQRRTHKAAREDHASFANARRPRISRLPG